MGAFAKRLAAVIDGAKSQVTPFSIAATEMPASGKTGEPVEDAARVNALFLTSFELGVEVSQATDDEAPVAIAYMDIDPATITPGASP